MANGYFFTQQVFRQSTPLTVTTDQDLFLSQMSVCIFQFVFGTFGGTTPSCQINVFDRTNAVFTLFVNSPIWFAGGFAGCITVDPCYRFLKFRALIGGTGPSIPLDLTVVAS